MDWVVALWLEVRSSSTFPVTKLASSSTYARWAPVRTANRCPATNTFTERFTASSYWAG